MFGPAWGTPRGSGIATNAGRSCGFAAEGIGRPAPIDGIAVEHEARAHLVLAGAVRVALGRHRADEAHLVDQLAQSRQQVRRGLAALTARAELVGAARQSGDGALERDDLSARERLAVPRDELRLEVPGIEMTAAAGTEDLQNAFRFELLRCGGVKLPTVIRAAGRQTRQRHAAETVAPSAAMREWGRRAGWLKSFLFGDCFFRGGRNCPCGRTPARAATDFCAAGRYRPHLSERLFGEQLRRRPAAGPERRPGTTRRVLFQVTRSSPPTQPPQSRAYTNTAISWIAAGQCRAARDDGGTMDGDRGSLGKDRTEVHPSSADEPLATRADASRTRRRPASLVKTWRLGRRRAVPCSARTCTPRRRHRMPRGSQGQYCRRAGAEDDRRHLGGCRPCTPPAAGQALRRRGEPAITSPPAGQGRRRQIATSFEDP